MEIVSGIASASQLAAYCYGVSQRLVQLHKAVQEGPGFCRTQRSNICFLLESIQRICIGQAPDTVTILPLLIDTANVATSLLNLLKPKGTLYNHWLWVSKGEEIESAFRALNDKIRLLQLHITEGIYNTVSHVQKDIKTMSQNIDCPSSQMDQRRPPVSDSLNSPKGTTQDAAAAPTGMQTSSAVSISVKDKRGHVKITADENKAKDKARHSVATGWGKHALSADVTANKNEVAGDAIQDVANAEAV
ncbi:MAG: hypothetical protein Q9166_005639 [cf. Caloplaca sp. 2 TL-2023]